MDETVNVLVKKLEHAATAFPELQNEKILDVSVCLLYSCVRVESGYLYWWGVMPLGYRHRLWEKSRSKSKKNKALHSGSDFQVGSSVRRKFFIFFKKISLPGYAVGCFLFRLCTGMQLCTNLVQSDFASTCGARSNAAN